MSSSEQCSAAPTIQEAQKRFQMYFTALAPNYGHLTGNTTRNLLLTFMQHRGALLLHSDSKIHDNAAGAGTATEAIIDWTQSRGETETATIIASDYVSAMIDALNKLKQGNKAWAEVTGEVADSHSLPYPDKTFSHSFCNFSIFTLAQPLKALEEMYRTLAPNGVAVIATWKRFAVSNVMREAPKVVQGPHVTPIPVPGEQFMQEGYLADMVAKAGWEASKVTTVQNSLTMKDGEDLDGLMESMTGPMSGMTRTKFTNDEIAKWPQAVTEAIETKKKLHGGLLMEARIVTATK